jgi:caffeoyl-CoA O-methyltransferase
MNKTFGNDDQALERYVWSTYSPEDAVLREIRQRSAAAGLPEIQLTALDARHLEVLVRAAGARRAVEIGTLGGYSGVAILRGLTADGTLDTFELDPDHARVAEETFRTAGFAGRARVHVGPALDRLRAIEAGGPYDVCFIDADKEGYPAYLDWAARNLRSGGLVIGDNAFLFGEIGTFQPDVPGEALTAMRAFHRHLASGGDFRATTLPTGEGLALGVRI